MKQHTGPTPSLHIFTRPSTQRLNLQKKKKKKEKNIKVHKID